MDEIEQIRALRANLPRTSAEKREEARAALLERIESIDGPAPRRSSAPLWKIQRARLLATAAGALVAAIVVSILVLGGGEAGVQSAAARVLSNAAAVAAAQPSQAPLPGQYLFTRSKTGYLEYSLQEGPRVAARIKREFKRVLHTSRGITVPHWWYFVSAERMTWTHPNGPGWSRTVSGKAKFLSARQREEWARAGSPRLPRAGRVSLQRFRKSRRHNPSIGFLPFMRLAQLPTEPRALRSWIEAHDPHAELSTAGTTSTGLPPLRSAAAKTFAGVAALLQQSAAPPALRAALYEVASELPGVQLLGTVSDPVGRKGIGVACSDPQHGERLELIFDPKTSTLLGERWVLTSPRRSGSKPPPAQ